MWGKIRHKDRQRGRSRGSLVHSDHWADFICYTFHGEATTIQGRKPMMTRFFAVALALVFRIALADVPACQTKEQGEVCTRFASNCDKLFAQEEAEPTGKWIGCGGATIFRMETTLAGLHYYVTSVLVDASYSDSERMDITIQMNGETYKVKDVQIVKRDGFHVAESVLAALPRKTDVPTVETTEKGGKRTVSHYYK